MSSTIPTTMRAFVTAGAGKPATVQLVPIPTPGPDDLLIKVAAAAQNPIDPRHAARQPAGHTIGEEYAGTVVAVGANVKGFKKGERVAGFTPGGQFTDRGAFAEYVVADAQIVWRIPQGKSFEEASTMSVGYVSALLSRRSSLTPLSPSAWKLPSRPSSTLSVSD
jgi:NADPH:quinone reductase-like Zn-dependent oxidoreductase